MVDQTTQPEPPNQIIPVGDGFLIAIGGKIKADVIEHFMEVWSEKFPGVPMIIVPESKVFRLNDNTILFEFSGDITKELVHDFRAWWDERQSGERTPNGGFKFGVPYTVGQGGPSWARGRDVTRRGARQEGETPRSDS